MVPHPSRLVSMQTRQDEKNKKEMQKKEIYYPITLFFFCSLIVSLLALCMPGLPLLLPLSLHVILLTQIPL